MTAVVFQHQKKFDLAGVAANTVGGTAETPAVTSEPLAAAAEGPAIVNGTSYQQVAGSVGFEWVLLLWLNQPRAYLSS